jgi:hypothetical protein
MNIDTKEILENGSVADIEMHLWETKEAIATRHDIPEIVSMLLDNGVMLPLDAGTEQMQICGKKRPI